MKLFGLLLGTGWMLFAWFLFLAGVWTFASSHFVQGIGYLGAFLMWVLLPAAIGWIVHTARQDKQANQAHPEAWWSNEELDRFLDARDNDR